VTEERATDERPAGGAPVVAGPELFECLTLLARAPFGSDDVPGAMAVLSSQAQQIANLSTFPFAVRTVIVPRTADEWLLDAAIESHDETVTARPRREPGSPAEEVGT